MKYAGFTTFSTEQGDGILTVKRFAIADEQELVLRQRPTQPQGYAPLPQSRLQELLDGFSFDRSVLLADSRLELLLNASL